MHANTTKCYIEEVFFFLLLVINLFWGFCFKDLYQIHTVHELLHFYISHKAEETQSHKCFAMCSQLLQSLLFICGSYCFLVCVCVFFVDVAKTDFHPNIQFCRKNYYMNTFMLQNTRQENEKSHSLCTFVSLKKLKKKT